MNTLLVIVPAVGAALAWLSAVVASLQMVKHRAEGVSVAYLLTHGIAFFTGSAFKPEAAPYRRRFVVLGGGLLRVRAARRGGRGASCLR